jgi:hypothetical protein
MRNVRWIAALAIVLLAAPHAADAGRRNKNKNKEAPTAPGTYTDWNEDLDRIEIVETFALADYDRLVVGDFATDGVPLPAADDNTYEPVKQVLADVEGPLIEGLREAGAAGLAVERQGSGAAAGARSLLLRGRVVEMDPGSRAARYWAGFGAGATRVELEGELVDAASGRVLFRFTQERRSGFGVGGGKYENLMQRSLSAIGEDLAGALQQF